MRVLLLIFSLIFLQNTVFAIDNAQVWNSYLGSAERTIKSNWYKLSGLNRHQKECSTNLYFNIKNTGEIYGIKVLSSNCSDEIKNLAIKAVTISSPLKPFPAEIHATNEISIDYIFNYELLPENKEIFKENKTPQQQQNLEAISDVASELGLNSDDNSSATVVSTETEKENMTTLPQANDNNKRLAVCFAIVGAILIILGCLILFWIRYQKK